MTRTSSTATAEEISPQNLSTKVTVIVFWGLIVAGLIFAALMLRNREADMIEKREMLADSLRYQLHELIGEEHLPDLAEVSGAMQQVLAKHRDIGFVLHMQGRDILRLGRQMPGRNPQIVTEHFYLDSNRGKKTDAVGEFRIIFPSLQESLYWERAQVLLTLGAVLLVFGIILKGLLVRVLTRPMVQMERVARAISEGRNDLVFDEDRQDEFGYLAKFVNRALEDMRKAERELEREARLSRELAEVTLRSIGEGVITTNRTGRVVYMNPVAEQLLERDVEDARGQFLQDLMPLVDENAQLPLKLPLLKCLRENREVELSADVAVQLPSGRLIPIDIYAAPLRDEDGAVHGAVMVLHDVSEARQLRRELTYQATHDALTGLYNRREFDREVQRALERSARDGHQHTLCYMDLDQFKVVNDICGHAAGDQLLNKLTGYLKSRLRKADVLARLGGDEFGLLLGHCPLHQALETAENLREVVKEFRFQWHDKSFQVGVSIGLVELTPAIGTAAEALAAADMACYAAKEGGRNRVHVYRLDDAELSQRREEMGMVSAVQRSLADDHLELFAQIIAPVREATLLPHYEILVRMRDPEGKYISPGAFIPAAERYQLMSSIDRWVVSHALRFAAAQARAGKPIELSINLSGQSLSEDLFLDFVISQIDQSGVVPEYLCFEITETAVINNLACAIRFMTAVRQLGCHFALDDFGSGMSSFGYLKNLPVDVLKIDGSFIKHLHEDPIDQSMVRAIQEVARLMNMKTVAEFVENAEILQVLREIGIDSAQGYFLGKPAPLTELFPGCEHAAASSAAPQLKLVRS